VSSAKGVTQPVRPAADQADDDLAVDGQGEARAKLPALGEIGLERLRTAAKRGGQRPRGWLRS